MIFILLKRLGLLATASVFVAAMVAAPLQVDFASGTLVKAVAQAGDDQGEDADPGDQGEDD